SCALRRPPGRRVRPTRPRCWWCRDRFRSGAFPVSSLSPQVDREALERLRLLLVEIEVVDQIRLVVRPAPDIVQLHLATRVFPLAREHQLELQRTALLERPPRLDPPGARTHLGDAGEALAVLALRVAEPHAGEQMQRSADRVGVVLHAQLET